MSTQPSATPEDLAIFVQGLDDDLVLPALWLVRRGVLGAILRLYEPDAQSLEILDDHLFTHNRRLYDFVQERMEEN